MRGYIVQGALSSKKNPKFCARSILYQRGIYPPEDFKRAPKYGLTMMVASGHTAQMFIYISCLIRFPLKDSRVLCQRRGVRVGSAGERANTP